MNSRSTGSASCEFSVIVPTRNRPQRLREVLRAITKFEFPRESFEVIVAADGLGQELESVAREFEDHFSLIVLEQRQQGAGAARNAGAARARGRYLAFTDDDCQPSPNWLHALRAALTAHPDALIGGKTTNTLEGNMFAATSQLIHEIVYDHYNARPERATFLASNNLAAAAEEFRQVGGFDPSFRIASEDRELCDRWLWSGRPMRYEPSAVVGHGHDMTLTGFCGQHFRYGRGAAQYHRLRAARGSGTFSEHLPFHRNVDNWLTPAVDGNLSSRLRVGSLLLVWQACNAAGFLYEEARRLRPGARPSRNPED